MVLVSLPTHAQEFSAHKVRNVMLELVSMSILVLVLSALKAEYVRMGCVFAKVNLLLLSVPVVKVRL